MSQIGLPPLKEKPIRLKIKRNEECIERVIKKKELLRNRLRELRYELEDLKEEIVKSNEHCKLVALKKKRLEHEKEILSLKNNIERLKNIECRLWREIKLFNNRSTKMEESKKRNIRKKKANEKKLVRMNKGIKARKKHCEMQNEKISQQMRLKREILMFKKKKNAEKIRKEKEKREKKIRKMKKRAISLKQIKYIRAVKETTAGRIKRELMSRNIMARASERIKKDRLKEKKKLNKIQKDIDKMCLVEDKWLVKLKASKQVHDLALENLNKAYETNDYQETMLETSNSHGGFSEGNPIAMRDSYISEDDGEDSLS